MSLRARLHLIPVLLSVLLPVLVLAQSDPAAADAGWYEDIVDGCKDLPSTMLGTVTGTIGFIAGQSGGPSLAFIPPAAAPVAVPGAVAGGTAAVSGTGAVGAGGVAAAAAVAVGAFCGTTVGLDWLFGEKDVLDALAVDELPAGTEWGVPVDCSTLGLTPTATNKACLPYGLQPMASHIGSGDTYIKPHGNLHIGGAQSSPVFNNCKVHNSNLVAMYCDPNAPNLSYLRPAGIGTAGYIQSRWPPEYYAGVNAGWPRVYPHDGLVAEVDCTPAQLMWLCGIDPNVGLLFQDGASNCVNNNNCVNAWWQRLSPVAARQGYARRVVTKTECWEGAGNWTVITMTNEGEPYWDGDGFAPQSFAPDPCPDGSIPRRLTVDRRAMVGGTPEIFYDWKHPAFDNPGAYPAPTMQCWVVGVTNCPTSDTDGDSQPEIGGPGGQEAPANTPGLRKVLKDGFELTPAPNPNPTTTIAPTTTAVTNPSTSTTSTTTPDDGGGKPGEPSGPLAPPLDPGSNQCVPEGWGWFNPVEWVLKPVKCALMWAFWDQDAADEMTGLWGETGSDWTAAVEFTDAVGPCVELAGQSICSSFVLGFTLPAALSTLITASVVFFTSLEIVGLFSRITGG